MTLRPCHGRLTLALLRRHWLYYLLILSANKAQATTGGVDSRKSSRVRFIPRLGLSWKTSFDNGTSGLSQWLYVVLRVITKVLITWVDQHPSG